MWLAGRELFSSALQTGPSSGSAEPVQPVDPGVQVCRDAQLHYVNALQEGLQTISDLPKIRSACN